MSAGESRMRRFLGLGLVLSQLAVVVVTGSVGVSRAAAAPPAAPTTVVTAKAASPIAAGAQAIVDLTVRNQGQAALAAPVDLVVTGLPAGVTVVRADTDLAGRSWVCTATATCRLVGADGTTPADLGGTEAAGTRLRLVATASAAIAATVTVGLKVTAGVSSPPAATGAASTTVTLTKLASGRPGSLEVVAAGAGLLAGARTSLDLTVTNLGQAAIGGSAATVVATGVLPPGSASWTASGTGWTCADASGLPKCTWTGGARAAGVSIDRLHLDFTAPTTASAAGQRLSWTRTIVATPGSGTAVSVTDTVSQPVLTAVAPVVKVFVGASGSGATEPGGSISVIAGVAGSGLVDPSRTVTIKATLPAGWSYASRSGADPWTCATSGQALSCTRSAAFAAGSSSSTTISLTAGTGAVVGTQVVTFTGSVSGTGAGAATTAAVTIAVNPGGVPLASVRRWAYPSGGGPALVTDGSSLAVVAGTTALFGLDVQDVGGAPIARGATINLAVDLPAGATATAQNDPSKTWTCSTSTVSGRTRASCTTTTSADIAVNAATERLKLAVGLPSALPVGPTTWPVTVSATRSSVVVPSLALSTAVSVNVAAPVVTAPVLTLGTTLTRKARAGGRSALLQVIPANTGNAALGSGWAMTAALPAALSSAQIKTVPSGCVYTPVPGPIIACASPTVLAAGTAAAPLVLPVAVPGGSPATVALLGIAASAPVAKANATIDVLPALKAVATATPDRVVLPPDASLPTPAVQLDGRASVADDATASWAQVPASGEPPVTFTGLAAGQAASGTVTSFTPPRVSATTTLHFRLTVTDTFTTATVDVPVVVEAPPVQTQPTATGTASGGAAAAGGTPTVVPASGPQGFRRPAAGPAVLTGLPDVAALFAPAAVSAGSGSWTWTFPPHLSSDDIAAGHPVNGSRLRYLDDGTYVWNGPGPAPTGVTVSHVWQQCDGDGADETCTDVGTDATYIPYAFNVHYVVVVTIAGTDAAGQPVSTSELYRLGTVGVSYDAPRVLVAPSINGAPAVGAQLTADPGEGTVEFHVSYQWLRCADAVVEHCTPIDGAQDPTYTVTPADAGQALRVQVRRTAIEGDSPVTTASSAVRSGAVIACGTNCYTWSAAPTIDRDGLQGPSPATGRTATVVTNGTFAWTDPTSAPAQVDVTVEWFTCDPAHPTVCTSIGTGGSVTPPTPGVALEARVTATGRYAEDGSTRTGTIVVPFGTVIDGNAPPVASTAPSIGGTTYVGDVLTADPGVWSGAIDATRTYSWLRCAAAQPDVCAPVGVTTPTYQVRDADLTAAASVMRVDVTAPGFVNAGTARSAPSARLTGYGKRLIAPPMIDPVAGGLRVGATVTATQAVWSEMPATTVGPSLRWQACTSTDPATCAGGQAVDALVLTDLYAGTSLRVISAISGEAYPSGSREVTQASAVVGPVAAAVIPVTATTDLPGGTTSVGNAAIVTVHGSGTGAGTLRFHWAQVSGPAVLSAPVDAALLQLTTPAAGAGTATIRLTVTDGTGQTATTDITVVFGPPPSTGPAELCDAVTKAQSGQIETLTYGAFTIAFALAGVNHPACDNDSVVTLRNAQVRGFGWFSIALTTVTINAAGVVIEGGVVSLTTGTPLDGTSLTLPSGSSLAIPFGVTDGSYEMTGALVGTSMPAFFNLFQPWTGATRLAFGNAGGVQTIAFAGRVWDGSAGAATPQPGQLPAPPPGSPVLDIAGTIATDATFTLQVDAVGLVPIATSSLDVHGTISHTAGGSTTYALQASLAAPVALAAGVSLDTATLAWDGSTFTGGGGVSVTTNGGTLQIRAAFSFQNPKAWAATLSVNGAGTWTPVAGLRLTNPTVSGGIQRSATGTQLFFTISAATVTIASGVVLTAPKFTVSTDCATGSSCPVTLALSTGITVSMFGGSVTGNVVGSLVTGTGTFTAAAGIGSFTITDGLAFTSAILHIDKGASGLDIHLSTQVQLFSTALNLTIRYDANGALVMVDVGTWTPFSGAPTMTGAWFVYSSYATTVSIGGQDVDVAARSLQLAAHTTVPKWFGDLIGDQSATADVHGAIGLSPLTLHLSLDFSFANVQVLSVGGVQLHVDQVGIQVDANGSSFSSALTGAGTLHIPAIGSAAPADLAVQVSLYYQPSTASIGGSISLVPPSSGQPAWLNAFGVPNLTVQNLSVAVGISFGGAPRLGFAGTVVLPGDWLSSLGIAAGTPITLAASIAGPASCFGVEIGTAGTTANVVDVANLHALTAKHASLYIAPSGCTIGTTTIAPGVAIAFDGAILGVSVKANLAITPSPFAISASLQLGDIDLKGLQVQGTSVAVEISPAVRALRFSAKAVAFGVTADVSGSFELVGGQSSITFHGAFASPQLGGFKLDRLALDFRWVSNPQSLSITADTQVQVMSATVAVHLDLQVLLGRVREASGSAALTIPIGSGANSFTINGQAAFDFTTNNFPTISIAGSATAGGRTLTTVNATLRAGYLEFAADLAVAGVFTSVPHVAGWVMWDSTGTGAALSVRDRNGNTVAAQPGDFRFEASGIGMSVSGFTLSAAVAVGRIGGVVYGDITTRLDLGIDQFGIAAAMTGSFDSTGNLSLTGNGRVTIGGIGTQLAFSVVRQSGTFSVSASASIAVPTIGSAAISGSFTRDAQGRTLYQLAGSIRLNTAGYDFGNASFLAYRQASGSGVTSGLQADANVNVPDLVAGAVRMFIYGDGSFAFSTNLTTQGALGAALNRPQAYVSFRHTPSNDVFSFSLDIDHAMKIPASFSLVGTISRTGGFDVSAGVQVGPFSGSTDFGVCTAYYSADANLTVHVIGGAGTTFSIAVSASGNVSAGCGSVGVGVGFAANFRYTAPSTFALSLQVRLDFGSLGSWNPTVYSA